MREATRDDLNEAQDTLYGIMHKARLLLIAMDHVELVGTLPAGPKARLVYSIENVLTTIERDAEAAADKLIEPNIGGGHA